MPASALLAAALQKLTTGAWLEAERAARAAMAADEHGPHAPRVLGLAIAAMGEAARAAPALMLAAALAPAAKHPCVDLITLKPTLPRPLVARQFRACLRLAPLDARLRLAFADFLLDAGQPAEAAETLRDGPDSAAAHHLRGLAQAELSNFPAAISEFTRATDYAPDAAASWSNLGMMLKVEGRFAEAVAAHDNAIALDPADHRYKVNRAVTLLRAGDWEPAWRDYESRLALTDAPAIDSTKLMPSLTLGDRLAGRTILAQHEDGFGDTLQFLRYIPLLADLGARVIACVPPPLTRILQSVPGVAEVVNDPADAPPHDFIAPMFSLPRVFGTTVQTIPPVPPFTPDPALVKRWAGRLPTGGLRAGLVWAGQARPTLPGFGTLDRRRSAGIAAFLPLFAVPGVSFVSLQAGPAARQSRPAGLHLTDPMADVTDFADTAALIAGLDVVISVDTSVVHLAGLLGKPVFLLDRYDSCWRWLSERRDSPWYPNLTLFRQARPGDWTSPIAWAAASLEAMAMFRGYGATRVSVRENAFVA